MIEEPLCLPADRSQRDRPGGGHRRPPSEALPRRRGWPWPATSCATRRA